jgi:F-box protein 11
MAIDPDKPHAFLSYTRSDDNYFNGGISWLRGRLEQAVQARTGAPFQIFQDVEHIDYGDRWEKKLDQALKEAQIFIPILTPSFFHSNFCRREAQAFLNYAAQTRRDDLILPLYLIYLGSMFQ